MIDPLMIKSIVFFLLLLFFLGFSLLYLCRVHTYDSWFLRAILYLGSGLCALIPLSVLFDELHIPQRYDIFLFISLLCPVYYLLKNYHYLKEYFSSSFSLSVSLQEVVSYFIIFFAILFLSSTYLFGAFSYPYLEDDDPWEHAVAVKYIAETGSYHQKSAESISHYLEPYPPFYDVALSFLYGINHNLSQTLKIGNILFIFLGFFFFFLFAKELFGLQVSIVATLLLVALPSWASHFIWTHTLGLILIFPALTLSLRALKEKIYRIPTIIAIAAALLAHPFVAIIFGVIFILFFLWQFFWEYQNLEQKKNIFFTSNHASELFIIGLFGIFLSLFYWLQQIARHGLTDIFYSHTGGFGGVTSMGGTTPADVYINPAYTLKDIFIAPIITKIDQPTGFGVMVCVLVISSLLFIFWNSKNYWQSDKKEFVVVSWFFIMLLGLLSGHLPFSILAHRFWAYASIPMVLLVALFLIEIHKKIWHNKILWSTVFLIISIGIVGVPFTSSRAQELNPDFTVSKVVPLITQDPFWGIVTAIDIFSSWQPKKIVETMQWPPGIAWSSVQELEGYLWMQQNILQKKVLTLCKQEKFLVGSDLQTNFPSAEMNVWRQTLAEKTVNDIALKAKEYDYLSLEYSCVKNKYLSEEELNNLANNLAKVFVLVYNNEEIVVYQVD